MRPIVLSIATALSTIALSALTACGGGGGSTDTGSTGGSSGGGSGGSSGSTDVIASAGTLQTTSSANTYGAGSLGDNYITALNNARAAAGAGVVNQSTALDTAAAAHALYEVTNLDVEGVSHVEISTSTNYYADTFTARDIKAGYAATSVGTEVLGGTTNGTDFAYGLLSTAYHGAAELSASTDVGFGTSVYPYGIVANADFGAKASLPYGQIAGTGKFIAYPYAGQTDVIGTFYASSEVPRVSTTLLPNATAGAPVIVNIQNADYLNFGAARTLHALVTSFSMTDGAGNIVPAVIIANSTITGSGVTVNADPNLGAGFVELIATSPLTSGTTYTVTFSATLKSGGAALSKTWSFLVL